jgi:RNA polymerase sigma-70 factor (ECF subfamily)
MHIAARQDQIQRAQQGDTTVIGALYEQYHLGIYRYFYYRIGDIHTAEDLAAEVFLRMIHSLPGYQHKGVSIQAWLYQIAHNLAIDHYRKARLRNHDPLEDHTLPHPDNVDATVQRSLDSEELKHALDRLHDDQREVIILRFIADMSIDEVSQVVQKTQDSVKGLQRRGLAALRQALESQEVSHG